MLNSASTPNLGNVNNNMNLNENNIMQQKQILQAMLLQQQFLQQQQQQQQQFSNRLNLNNNMSKALYLTSITLFWIIYIEKFHPFIQSASQLPNVISATKRAVHYGSKVHYCFIFRFIFFNST